MRKSKVLLLCWRQVLVGIFATLLCCVSVCMGNSKEKYFRQVADVSEIEVMTLARDMFHADVLRLIPSRHSGEAIASVRVDEGGRIDYESVIEEPVTLSGDFKLLARIGDGLPDFRIGSYKWEMEERMFTPGGSTSMDRLYNPFVLGGDVLVQPIVTQQHVKQSFECVRMLFTGGAHDLQAAVSEWKRLSAEHRGNTQLKWDLLIEPALFTPRWVTSYCRVV